MPSRIKRLSPALLLILILVGGGIVVGALVFGDDRKEMFDRFTEKRDLSQPMEVKGDWLGMSLVDLTSPSARRAGLTPGLKGVMVSDISETAGWRARAAGVIPRDVVLTVNRTKISDINDLYDLTRKINVTDAVFLDVNRYGQVATVVLPSVTVPPVPVPPVAAGFNQPAMAGPQPAMMAPAAAPVQMQLPAAAFNAQPVAQPAQFAGPRWLCRRHGLAWPQQAVQPGFRCPYCNEPLRSVP
jgi:hypothetical protein